MICGDGVSPPLHVPFQHLTRQVFTHTVTHAHRAASSSRKLCEGAFLLNQRSTSISSPEAIKVSSESSYIRLTCPITISTEAFPIRVFVEAFPSGNTSIACPSAGFMSFWTCASCTFVNQGSSNKCEMCEQTRKPISSSTPSAAYLSLTSSQQEDASKWGCRSCTFLNRDSDKFCDICGTPKSSISFDTFAEIDSTLDEDGESRGTKFWPLRSCTSSVSESRESSQTFNELGSISVSTSTAANTKMVNQADKKRMLNQEDKKRKHQEDDKAVLSMESDYGSSGGVSNAVLRNLHLEKMKRSKQSLADMNKESPSQSNAPLVRSLASDSSSVGDANQSIVILTYNVWFREDLEVLARMNAIGGIISEHNPHFICFQEVTPAIYNIFQHSSWWGHYQCSLAPVMAIKRAYFCLLLSRVGSTSFRRNSYHNTVMGRELCIAESDVPGGRQLFVATTHLESPCPAPPTWDQMFSAERVFQAKEALNVLKDHPNVVFGGDMNWDDKLDGIPPLPANWCDAWLTLRPNEEGLTYDSKQNPLLTGSRLRKRLDRMFCHLEDYRLESIEIVGTTPIPGVMFEKDVKVKKQSQKLKLPVLPSDHFGLLLKIIQK